MNLLIPVFFGVCVRRCTSSKLNVCKPNRMNVLFELDQDQQFLSGSGSSWWWNKPNNIHSAQQYWIIRPSTERHTRNHRYSSTVAMVCTVQVKDLPVFILHTDYSMYQRVTARHHWKAKHCIGVIELDIKLQIDRLSVWKLWTGKPTVMWLTFHPHSTRTYCLATQTYTQKGCYKFCREENPTRSRAEKSLETKKERNAPVVKFNTHCTLR